MKYFKKLVGERIYLSPRNAEDVETFTKWMNDFQITDYLGRSGNIVTLGAEKKYLEEDQNSEASFAIVTMDGDEMIGTVSLEKIDHKDGNATLGIYIGEENYRDNGYGTETIRLILDYGFNYMNLHNIFLEVMSFNERAIKCYKKCGFKEIGKRRACVYTNGKYYDSIYMDILKEEFEGNYIKNKNI